MLWWKSSNGMCSKLHTVAASNNRDHRTRSLSYCLFTSHIFVCCSLRTSHLWWTAFSTQHQLRGCNNVPSLLQWTAPIAHSFCEGWNLSPPSHPGQSTSLLWLNGSGGKYAKLHTVAASNNRDSTSYSFYFCLFATHIHGCCSSRTSRSWRIAHSTQH